MSKIVEDAVFGKMHYDYSWRKEEPASWWDKRVLRVEIIAQAYEELDIIDIQRNTYQKYKEQIPSIIVSALPKLLAHINQLFDSEATEPDLFEKLTPTSVVFMRDSGWGILFNSKWDEEHGVAYYTNDGASFQVGEQGDFL